MSCCRPHLADLSPSPANAFAALAVAIPLLLANTSFASPNLVANGSFETTGSWTSRSGGANVERSNSPATYGISAAPAGSFFIEVEYFPLSPNTLNDWISQNIATTGGERYITSIFARTRTGSNTADRLIFFGGAQLSTVTTGNSWVNYSDSFVAAGSSTTVQYWAGGSTTGAIQPGDSVGLMADNAQVQEVTVSPANLVTTEDGNVASTAFQVPTNSTSATLSATFTANNGIVTLLSTTGLTITAGANNSASITVSGTPAALNTAFGIGVRYTPNLDFYGSTTLDYTVNAGTVSDTDAVPVTVSPVADIVADAVTTNENIPITFNVITGTNGASADNFENAGRSLTAVSAPANGSVTFLADGSVTYTPASDFSGTDTFAYTITSGGATETVTITVTVRPRPRITVTKISNGTTGTFSFTGTNGWPGDTIATAGAGGTGTSGNTGRATLAGVSTTLTEAAQDGWRVSAISCTGLGSGGSATPDISGRSITLDAAAMAPGTNISCTFTNERLDFTATKSVSTANMTSPGTLTFTFNLSNTGTAPLGGFAISDLLQQGAAPKSLATGPTFVSGDVDSDGLLDVAETWIYSATYQVTQSDIDNGGTFTNTATFDTPETVSKPTNTVTTTITQAPALTVDKTADTSVPLVAGQVVTYNFLVTNTGNVTVNGVDIVEGPFNGSGTLSTPAVTPTGASTTLAPGQTVNFTATYQVTQDDIDTLQP